MGNLIAGGSFGLSCGAAYVLIGAVKPSKNNIFGVLGAAVTSVLIYVGILIGQQPTTLFNWTQFIMGIIICCAAPGIGLICGSMSKFFEK